MRAVNAIPPQSVESDRSTDAIFETIYRDHFDYVWCSLRRLGVPESQCDDALQDLFVVVYRRLGEFDWNVSIRTWLFAIARRVAARQRRTLARTLRRRIALARDRLRKTSEPLDATMTRRDAEHRLLGFLDSLHEDQRAVFILSALEERRGPEIASMLDVSVNTVYSRLRLAREKFDRYCHRVQSEEAVVLSRGREARAPQGAKQSAWLVLAPKVGLASKTAGTRTAATGLAVNAKVFLSTVVVGGAALGALHVATPPSPANPPPLTDGTEPTRTTPDSPPAHLPPLVPAEEVQHEELPAPAPVSEREPRPTKPQRAVPVQVPASIGLEREADLLRAMKSALRRGDPEAALGHADLHAREFPDGQLAIDRQAYRAIALCELGRDHEGRGLANVYLNGATTPALAARVRTACHEK